jgi:hypothetical protein
MCGMGLLPAASLQRRHLALRLAGVIVWQAVVFVAGLVLVGWTVLSAIRTVILPRSAQSVLARWVFLPLGAIFRKVANEGRTFAFRDRVMALYAPIGLVALAGAWLVLVGVGYMLMFWALDPDRALGGAFHLSGSSITTLGFAPADTVWERVLAFTEAGWGLFVLTLMITYLPSMYSAFSRRETKVALLEVRAGTPPSAVEFILRHHAIGWLHDLDDTWLDWERWFAELEESHTSYPTLNFFRSPLPDRSWVTAAGTVLDSAALMAAAVDTGTVGPKGVCIRAGFLALRRIAAFFAIPFDSDPAPDDPISITRPEFDEALDRLAEAGVAVRPDRDQAWRDFAGWRVNYDVVLLALAEITMAPYAPWTSDRSGPRHEEPRIRRFGSRPSSGAQP